MNSAVPTKTDRLKKALMERYRVHVRDGTTPTSGRFLFYELEGKDDGHGVLVSKIRTGARRADQDLSTRGRPTLREAGEIPWRRSWTKRVTWRACRAPRPSPRPAGVSRRHQDRRWQWSRVRPYVICESRSLAGVLRDLCWRYGVNSTSTRTAERRLPSHEAGRLVRQPGTEQKILALYCGDADLGGNQIEENTRRVLEQACEFRFRWSGSC